MARRRPYRIPLPTWAVALMLLPASILLVALIAMPFWNLDVRVCIPPLPWQSNIVSSPLAVLSTDTTSPFRQSLTWHAVVLNSPCVLVLLPGHMLDTGCNRDWRWHVPGAAGSATERLVQVRRRVAAGVPREPIGAAALVHAGPPAARHSSAEVMLLAPLRPGFCCYTTQMLARRPAQVSDGDKWLRWIVA